LPPARVSAIAAYEPFPYRTGEADFPTVTSVAVKQRPGCTLSRGRPVKSRPKSVTTSQGLVMRDCESQERSRRFDCRNEWRFEQPAPPSSVDAAFLDAQRRAGEGVEFGTAMRWRLLRLRSRGDLNCVSILERGKLPHKGVIAGHNRTPGGLARSSHVRRCPREHVSRAIGRRTGCGEFKERTLRLRTGRYR